MSEALAYYVLVDCPECDAEIYYGPCLTLLEHNGRPVLSGSELEQTRVDCPDCDARIYYGELDYMTEGGRGGSDEESDDDDD
jgi:DNA-directed RNA polymerase subunit RPC12/RpoP